ncbi:hypothetical protein WICPIJ_007374 [Wickerhamomyces pijperi]|uniref:Glycoside hydrolase family 125 protein n=1 Tax=Wickerhamomyces pijperi TaxID=599730 RepID=A0A9P8TJB5_WICPI|nr:hypothetical protein WICPIJ_007374 [Wickerhamomyces pijperi]
MNTFKDKPLDFTPKPNSTGLTKLRYKHIRMGAILLLIISAFYFLSDITLNPAEKEDYDDLFEQRLNNLYRVQSFTADPEINGLIDPELINEITNEFKRVNSPGSVPLSPGSSSSKCISYIEYSQHVHGPLSSGVLKLPYQRPPEHCRTFSSPAVEKLLEDLEARIANPDLYRLVENALPNTLDTAILWYDTNNLPFETFISTGDIHAEWLRDSTRQLSIYHKLAPFDSELADMIKGAINTQADYIVGDPYCNAFHPPRRSNVKKGESAKDKVNPRPDWNNVFECKYEIDSIASFLTLTREYYESTKDVTVFTKDWFRALANVIILVKRESSPTFKDEQGQVLPFYYSFQRNTDIGTETLPLAGTGNPVNFGIGLVRSAFRPSDDACILQFFVPGNIQLQFELSEIHKILKSLSDKLISEIPELSTKFQILLDDINKYSNIISEAIQDHAIVTHPTYGKVYAYEVDGYGGSIFMDDANIPSLLSIPELTRTSASDQIYQNTREMILSKKGNPYYLNGPHFKGVGGPHIGIHNAWPMSLLVQIRTSNDDEEILELLELVLKNTGGLGLIHESINVMVPDGSSYTRSWFSWANSEFGKTILDLAERKPHLIFKDGYKKKPYSIEKDLKL